MLPMSPLVTTFNEYNIMFNNTSMSTIERDLGAIFDNKRNYSLQCQSAASKVNNILSCIRKDMASREETIILTFYKALV